MKWGGDSIGKIQWGSSVIGKVYHGSNLVYDAGGGPTPPTPIYQELQYIIASGGSAINTGIVANSTDVITVDYQIYPTNKNGDKFIVAAQSGYSGGGLWVESYGTSNKWYARFGSSSSASGTASSYTSGQHTLTLKKSYFGVDGTKVLTPSYNSMPNTAINFGGRLAANGSSATGFWGFLYECAITDSNGDYRWHGIPVKRIADSAIGMLDTVSNTLFTSAVTDFTAGPDKT